jgi:hypothetical protein
VRVSFQKVMTWSRDAITKFRFGDLRALGHMAELYDEWTARLAKLEVPEHGRRWLDEIKDGIEIDALRAHQIADLYESLLLVREGQDPRPTFERARRAEARRGGDPPA